MEELFNGTDMSTVLNEKQLFLISIDKYPFLLRGVFVLLYTDKEKAESASESFNRLYNDDRIKSVAVGDKEKFFTDMASCGFGKFLLNGDGKILQFKDYCSFKPSKTNSLTTLYNETVSVQPKRVIPDDESLKGLIKRLPSVHKTRFFVAYIGGVISLVLCIVYYIIKSKFDAAVTLLMYAAIFILYGVICVDKLSDRLKLKNPKVVRLAKCAWVLYVPVIIIFIVEIIAAIIAGNS